jgi:hypothetical protein
MLEDRFTPCYLSSANTISEECIDDDDDVLVVTHVTSFADLLLSACSFVRSFLIFASLKMYNSLVERCFCHCVESFRRKTLDKQEETCVKRCAEKYLKHSMRVSMRFAELNQGSPTPD